MSNYKSLGKFVAAALEEVLAGAPDLTTEKITCSDKRYELKLAKTNGEGGARLALAKKGNGRPVPTVSVNAVSSGEENLLHRDQRIDCPDKVARNVKKALEVMAESLESS